MSIFVQIAIAVVLSIVGYMLTPKPEIPKVEAQEFDPPDARADKPIVIVFGTKKVSDVNCLFAGDKSTRKRKT